MLLGKFVVLGFKFAQGKEHPRYYSGGNLKNEMYDQLRYVVLVVKPVLIRT
jgi:hypothetical protein